MNHDGHDDGLVGKHEDMELIDKRDKLLKPLNRVSRACNACRKQKMRCEGAESPPCKRCRNAGLECMFEKPSREASLTGEAGLERIRSLENSVSDIRQSQLHIQDTLNEVLATLRGGSVPPRAQSYQQYHLQQSPVHSSPSIGSIPTPTPSHAHPMDSSHAMPPPGSYTSSHSIASLLSSGHRPDVYRNPVAVSPQQSIHLPPPGSGYPHTDPNVAAAASQLPPISTFQQGQPVAQQHMQALVHPHMPGVPSSLKRPGLTVSTSNSEASSETEEDDGDLTQKGMIAPFEVLRSLADVAVQQDKIEKITDSAPPSRARTPPQQGKQGRPAKRRKLAQPISRVASFPDVVSKKIISEQEARELFRIFYHGCSTFLPVFDQNYDTYEALHERSPFAVNCICMVAALIRDKGKEPGATYKNCQTEVYQISQATLFSPVTRLEAVQSMILVAGWSENGWLAGGHAVRMALELSMHNAWPKLRRRMKNGNAQKYEDDRTLVSACRTWFTLYIFEHQISYGTGRPAILRDDDSIAHCRELLSHPLAVEDDMRLVSTVELMAVRERINARISSLDAPMDDNTFRILTEANAEFQIWYQNWDPAFAQRYEDAAFYRQSLSIQHMHAQLFHYAWALRNINGPDEILRMPREQRDIASQSIKIARQCMEITINSPAYREGMKYAVHYTHVTATFTASLLLRLSRLFPEECSFEDVKTVVKNLANLMSEVPAHRYSLTLKVMLRRYKQQQRRQNSLGRSPRHELHRPQPMHMDSSSSLASVEMPFSPTYAGYPTPETVGPPGSMPPPQAPITAPMPAHYAADAANVNYVWSQYESTPVGQQPTWVSDQSLGGNMFTQQGMNAFIVPHSEWGPPQHQIW